MEVIPEEDSSTLEYSARSSVGMFAVQRGNCRRFF